MRYNIGDKVYVVSGICRNMHTGTPETYYITTREVLKIGTYVTIGLKGDRPSHTRRFIPSDNEGWDSYSIFYGQGSGKSNIGSSYSVILYVSHRY